MREGGFQVKWYPTKLRKQMKLTIKAGQLTVAQSKGVPKWEGPDWEHWGHTIPRVVSTCASLIIELTHVLHRRGSKPGEGGPGAGKNSLPQ